MYHIALTLIAGLLFSAPLFAQHRQGHGVAPHAAAEMPYKGQHDRSIKSLSESDIRQLRAGAGWGFAKPAELSGYPGPRHVLDLASELKLTLHQRQQIEEIFNGMNASARKLGAEFVEAERALSDAFANGSITGGELGALTQRAGRLRMALRLTHLEAHLLVRPLLSRHQLMMYNKLRGYGNGSSRGHGGH